MGRKNYFCDYCTCYMKNDVNVRKTHNSGLAHTIAKANYLRQFEDPRKVLAIETAKVPCTRYLKGYCKFELFCQYSHYTPTKLEELRKICARIEKRAKNNKSSTDKKAKHRLETLLPWSINNSKRRRSSNLKRLPPSLQPIHITKAMTISLSTWGNN